MPLARDLHPEFGYIGNAPAVLRKLGFAIAFAGVGSIAAISNFSIFVSAPEDPMKAMALAPQQALNSPSPAAPSMLATSAPATEETAATGSRPCGGAITADSGVDCIPSKAHRSRSIPAANERPAIAAVAIGHRDEPAMLPAPPAPAVPAAPSSAMPPAAPSRADTFAPPAPPPAEAAVETAAPEAVPPPRAPAPAPAKKKAPPRRNYAQHRERGEHSRSSYRAPSYSYSYGYGYGYVQGGWGRIW